jgi:hypothetical protein
VLSKVIVFTLMACCLTATGYSQFEEEDSSSVVLGFGGTTIEGPLITLLTDITTATNLSIAPYAIYDTGTKSMGGGLLAVYNVTSWAAGGIGMQYLNQELWMPSAQFQLQAPVIINKSISLIPFVFTGIGTPIAGGSGKDFADNGSAVGIFGGGMAVKVFGDLNSSHLDVFTAIAKWSGFSGEQIYGGFVYRF